ncbi:MAG: hypothetical protein R6U67_03040 [Sodalinema sp.]|uniref:hypothetical protein n=1 Tax=Sodalinema sp. TaxID=3080550 RepID=UPI00396F4D7E
MSPNPDVIYAPSLYWFAYQYHHGLVISPETPSSENLEGINLHWLKQRYQDILDPFGINPSLSLRTDTPNGTSELLTPTSPQSLHQYEFISTKDEKLQGFLYPQSLHDCYALNLNLFCPEQFGLDGYILSDLRNLNPNHCFNPQCPPPLGDVGQTLLLTAYLEGSPPENIRELDGLARRCWLNFFHLPPDSSSDKFPPLYRAYDCLGGYLYEYGNPKQTAAENPYGHLLIWFLFDETPTLKLQEFYWDLPSLFLYYHKVRQMYLSSRIFYNKADSIVNETEGVLNKFNFKYLNSQKTGQLSEKELAELKGKLKLLLKESLAYSKELRNLEYAHNSIAINSGNYQAILEHMEQRIQEPLSPFRVFVEKEAIAFQKQIRADLNYFNPGSNLLNQSIATIRGLVEVDQAECDRRRQAWEKELSQQQQDANEDLQDQIQSIGVGIAAGAIVASTSGLITEKLPLPSDEPQGRSLPAPILFLLVLGLSVFCSWGAWKTTKQWIEKNRPNRINSGEAKPGMDVTEISQVTQDESSNDIGDQ